MNKQDLNARFAEMWKQSREDVGKSQEYISKALGISRKTVQNWEDGISSPNQIRAIQWFEALNLQPLPYYLDVFYPKKFKNQDNAYVDKALYSIISGLPMEMKEKLLFILSGNHGSSTVGIIEMVTAHLHVPLERRINIVQAVATNYELAEYQDLVCCKDDIRPDMNILIRSIELGKKAVITGNSSYYEL